MNPEQFFGTPQLAPQVEEQMERAETLSTNSENKESLNTPSIKKGQEKIHEMYAAGKGMNTYYLALASLLMKTEGGANTWKSPDEVETQKIETLLARIKQEEVAEKGREALLSMYNRGESNTRAYQSLHTTLTQNIGGILVWKDTSLLDTEHIEKLLAPEEFTVQTKERVLDDAEMLSDREASKKFFAEERNKIAAEIKLARKSQRERVSSLGTHLENKSVSDIEKTDAEYGELSDIQSDEADILANRIGREQSLDIQDIQEEATVIDAHIDNSERLTALKAELTALYEKSGDKAKEHLESIQKRVEHVLMRNNAFIVHTFLMNEELRHNANSNISGRATIEDDLDILLSLEPSISTSSVVPGSKQGLWGNEIGVVIGGGDVRGVSAGDEGTITGGIKYRNGTVSSALEIDEKVSDTSERSYNELVVNNPEIYGFFVNVQADESGKIFYFNGKSDTSEQKLNRFMSYIDLAKSKGIPPLVMTPDRRIFEFKDIMIDGSIEVGEEITPEDVAKGNAGLEASKRKEIGKDILSKNLFAKITDQQEAKEILSELPGTEQITKDMSPEEYMSYITHNPEKLYQLPKDLLGDKDFMEQAVRLNPVSAYEQASDELKRDLSFIELAYSLRDNRTESRSIYEYMPESLRLDPSIALLAIEHNDAKAIDYRLAENMEVWEKLMQNKIEGYDISNTFSRNVGEALAYNAQISMYDYDKNNTVYLSDKLQNDATFWEKLQSTYPNFSFEMSYGDLIAKKLS